MSHESGEQPRTPPLVAPLASAQTSSGARCSGVLSKRADDGCARARETFTTATEEPAAKVPHSPPPRRPSRLRQNLQYRPVERLSELRGETDSRRAPRDARSSPLVSGTAPIREPCRTCVGGPSQAARGCGELSYPTEILRGGPGLSPPLLGSETSKRHQRRVEPGRTLERRRHTYTCGSPQLVLRPPHG